MKHFEPELTINYHYLSGHSVCKSGEEAIQFHNSSPDLLYAIDFSYLLPALSPDSESSVRKEEIRFATGIQLGIGEFKRLIGRGCLSVAFKLDFWDKLLEGNDVCISVPYGAARLQNALAIRESDKVFDSTDELVQNATLFINNLNCPYNDLPFEASNGSKIKKLGTI